MNVRDLKYFYSEMGVRAFATPAYFFMPDVLSCPGKKERH